MIQLHIGVYYLLWLTLTASGALVVSARLVIAQLLGYISAGGTLYEVTQPSIPLW